MIVKTVKKMLLRVFDPRAESGYRRLVAGNEIGSLPDYLPEDVKEGHFVVHTVNENGEVKRFVIEMSYLAHPEFIRLLEHAAEEFGFEQEGVLAVPCRPNELTRILESKKQKRA